MRTRFQIGAELILTVVRMTTGLITSKDRLMFLLKLTVNRQGRNLRPITNKLNAPIGRWLRSDNGGRGLRLCNQFRCLNLGA
jgi:hypothetical protein